MCPTMMPSLQSTVKIRRTPTVRPGSLSSATARRWTIYSNVAKSDLDHGGCPLGRPFHDLSIRNEGPGPVSPWDGSRVRNTKSGELVHEGVDRDLLDPLIQDLLDYVNDGEIGPVSLRAAMTHLNLAILHPFSDGNGRTARCIQTAGLASEGIVAPIFSSIEEYIGHNQQVYYNVLAQVGGGGSNPARSAKPWVRDLSEGPLPASTDPPSPN